MTLCYDSRAEIELVIWEDADRISQVKLGSVIELRSVRVANPSGPQPSVTSRPAMRIIPTTQAGLQLSRLWLESGNTLTFEPHPDGVMLHLANSQTKKFVEVYGTIREFAIKPWPLPHALRCERSVKTG
jgi:hypothetical protein